MLFYFFMQLPCGHQCTAICHPGPCPSPEKCSERVKVRCACRRKKREFVCNDVRSGYAKVDCDDTCHVHKDKLRKVKYFDYFTMFHFYVEIWSFLIQSRYFQKQCFFLFDFRNKRKKKGLNERKRRSDNKKSLLNTKGKLKDVKESLENNVKLRKSQLLWKNIEN